MTDSTSRPSTDRTDRRLPWRRPFSASWIGLLLWALVVGCGSGGSAPEADRPLVILISLDTCRADLFGSMTGEEPSLTPRFDAFAADAVVFENAFVQFPHTLPSHMSMLTSVYPDVHGVKPEHDPLSESFVILPELLRDAGYRTVGLVTSEWLKPEFGFGRGFDEYDRLPHRRTYAGRVNAAALQALGSGERPYFLFLHYYDLHSDFDQGSAENKFPYYAPPQDREGLDVSADGREFCDDEGNCNTQYLMAADRNRRELSEEEIETIHALYRAAMPSLDAQMGELFDELKRRGLYDDALIVVTSDHGEEFREHGRFIHSQPYDETIRVPLFVKLPGGRMAGTRVSEVVETVDIMPTILEEVGLAVPDLAQGESLTDLLGERPERDKHAVLAQDSINQRRYALRSDDLKLIMDVSAGRRELYDLREDPGETVDLIRERPEAGSEMERRLKSLVHANRRLHDELGAGDALGGDVLSDEERKRLEALGYVD